MADLKRRVEKLETGGRNITEGKAFRIIVSDGENLCPPSVYIEGLCFCFGSFAIASYSGSAILEPAAGS